jgi:hypothetical protein
MRLLRHQSGHHVPLQDVLRPETIALATLTGNNETQAQALAEALQMLADPPAPPARDANVVATLAEAVRGDVVEEVASAGREVAEAGRDFFLLTSAPQLS